MQKLIISAIIFISIFSCNNNKIQVPNMQEEHYVNMTILLDLSDRIESKQQRERDLFIISELLEAFEERQRQFGFQLSKDRLSIAVAHQKNTQVDLFELGEKLCVDMSLKGVNKPKFDKMKKEFLIALDSLYSTAALSETMGADIWTFFRDQLPFYLSSSKNTKKYHNKLIILSDGYLQFDRSIGRKRKKGTYMQNISNLRNKSNWEELFEEQKFGLLPHDFSDIPDLEVFMVEIAPINPEINTNEMGYSEEILGKLV